MKKILFCSIAALLFISCTKTDDLRIAMLSAAISTTSSSQSYQYVNMSGETVTLKGNHTYTDIKIVKKGKKVKVSSPSSINVYRPINLYNKSGEKVGALTNTVSSLEFNLSDLE